MVLPYRGILHGPIKRRRMLFSGSIEQSPRSAVKCKRASFMNWSKKENGNVVSYFLVFTKKKSRMFIKNLPNVGKSGCVGRKIYWGRVKYEFTLYAIWHCFDSLIPINALWSQKFFKINITGYHMEKSESDFFHITPL